MIVPFATVLPQLTLDPWRIAGWAYFLIGFATVWIIASRRQSAGFQQSELWGRKNKAVGILKFVFLAGGLHPISFLIQVFLWPLWLLVLVWAYFADHT
jgi:hypothetical protein